MSGGRPPYDLVVMFKILVLQALYNLSHQQAEFMIRERLTFLRFLGLGLSDRGPDAWTIWLYRERPKKAGAIRALFAQFDDAVHDRGFLAKVGQLPDTMMIEAPHQRLDKQQREAVKTGKTPKGWTSKKAAHKHIHARWTLKRGEVTTSPDGQIQPQLMVPAFGYKAHTSIGKAGGLI